MFKRKIILSKIDEREKNFDKREKIQSLKTCLIKILNNHLLKLLTGNKTLEVK